MTRVTVNLRSFAGSPPNCAGTKRTTRASRSPVGTSTRWTLRTWASARRAGYSTTGSRAGIWGLGAGRRR